MTLRPNDLFRWWAGAKRPSLAALEGGERLRLRFASYLALRHPDVLSRFLNEKALDSPLALEEALGLALAEIGHGALADTATEWGLLAEWSRFDEDAYELLNSLRPA